MARPHKLTPPVPGDRLITSRELAARWGMKEGSIRMMRVNRTGPRYIALGRKGKGRRPRVRYWLSVVTAYENGGRS